MDLSENKVNEYNASYFPPQYKRDSISLVSYWVFILNRYSLFIMLLKPILLAKPFEPNRKLPLVRALSLRRTYLNRGGKYFKNKDLDLGLDLRKEVFGLYGS